MAQCSAPASLVENAIKENLIPTAKGYNTTGLDLSGCINTHVVPKFWNHILQLCKDPVAGGFHCTGYDTVKEQLLAPAYYGYEPIFFVGILFTVVFAVLTLAHTGLTIKSKRLWLWVMPIGGLGEIIGWIARTISAKEDNFSKLNYNMFLCQIVCLTISPAFFSSAVYGQLVLLVAEINSTASRFSPLTLAKVFIGCDVLSLVLQAAGGAIAAGAGTGTSEQKMGTNIMVGGIAFQLASMLLFLTLALDYFYTVHKKTSDWTTTPRKIKLLFYGTLFAAATIIIRGIYRTAELSEGWEGYFITHEVYFLTLDAAMMALCMILLGVFSPALLLPKTPVDMPLESPGLADEEVKEKDERPIVPVLEQ